MKINKQNNRQGSDHDASASDRDVIPIPSDRALVIDAGYLGAKRHTVYGLVEADVTKAKQIRLEKYNNQTMKDMT